MKVINVILGVLLCNILAVESTKNLNHNYNFKELFSNEANLVNI